MERPKINYFKDWVPKWVGFGLCLFFVFVFQFSGGIYLSSAAEMVGDLALLREDIMMTGAASMVGMSLIFPALFRFKFRFSARRMFMVICPVIILCNYITMTSESRLVLLITSFIAGTFRMWGTFECFSNLQLTLTPTRDFEIFFPFIYCVILSSIQLSGVLTAYISWWFEWRYMHILIIGLLLVVWLLVAIFLKEFHAKPPESLKGLDWFGWFLWAVFLLSFIFVCEYGEHFDWFDSGYIRLATVLSVVSLIWSVKRMFTKEAPFIGTRVFKYKNMTLMLVLLFLMCMLTATPSVLQNAFTGSILNFDRLNTVRLNWWCLVGVIFGSGLAYVWIHKMHGGIRFMLFFSFATAVLYQVIMYFIIDPAMNIEYLFIPSMLLYAGYAVMYSALTIYAVRIVPFQHFFQMLAVFGFVRSAAGSPIATAIYSRVLNKIVPKNFALITAEMDAVNPDVAGGVLQGHGASVASIYGDCMTQAMLASMKEIYGWVCICGIILLILILAYREPGPVAVLKRFFGEHSRRIIRRLRGTTSPAA